jgi:hypothetical protein
MFAKAKAAQNSKQDKILELEAKINAVNGDLNLLLPETQVPQTEYQDRFGYIHSEPVKPQEEQKTESTLQKL